MCPVTMAFTSKLGNSSVLHLHLQRLDSFKKIKIKKRHSPGREAIPAGNVLRFLLKVKSQLPLCVFRAPSPGRKLTAEESKQAPANRLFHVCFNSFHGQLAECVFCAECLQSKRSSFRVPVKDRPFSTTVCVCACVVSGLFAHSH